MNEQINQAKKRIRELSEKVISSMPVREPENAIQDLQFKLERLQHYIDKLPDQAFELANRFLDDYESSESIDVDDKFRNQVMDLIQEEIFRTRDNILEI